jgi:hypothetical protein
MKQATNRIERISTTMSSVDVDSPTTYDRGMTAANGLLSKVFSSCAEDPRGSVHRAWGISLIFIILYFIVSVIESKFSFACVRVCLDRTFRFVCHPVSIKSLLFTSAILFLQR